jgi:hypothetical protein
MANIKADQAPIELQNNFKAAALHFFPYDPVQKKKTTWQQAQPRGHLQHYW